MSAFCTTQTCNRDEGLWTPRFLACKPKFSFFSELDGGQATGTGMGNIRKKPTLVWDGRSRHLKTCNNNQQENGMVMDHLDFKIYREPSSAQVNYYSSLLVVSTRLQYERYENEDMVKTVVLVGPNILPSQQLPTHDRRIKPNLNPNTVSFRSISAWIHGQGPSASCCHLNITFLAFVLRSIQLHNGWSRCFHNVSVNAVEQLKEATELTVEIADFRVFEALRLGFVFLLVVLLPLFCESYNRVSILAKRSRPSYHLTSARRRHRSPAARRGLPVDVFIAQRLSNVPPLLSLEQDVAVRADCYVLTPLLSV